jgi:hypothetical protein
VVTKVRGELTQSLSWGLSCDLGHSSLPLLPPAAEQRDGCESFGGLPGT